MNRLHELEMRRHELIERSAAQRGALRANLAPLTDKLALVDRAMTPIRRYPIASTAVAAAVMLFGSRKIFTLIARGITLYTLLRKI